jgi:DNA polymerase-3 subunit alpha
MASFAEYGFNKSHSAAYALVTYRTAYLKAHYPVEFMAAVLSSELNDTDKIAEYVDECRTLGIEILPPDVNVSEELFTVENGNIRYGLSAIKGVGGGAIKSVVDSRNQDGPFKSLGDFTRRVDTSQVNSRVIDGLIKAGAFNFLELKKSQLLEMATDALKSGHKAQKDKNSGQITFFDLLGDEAEGLGDIEIAPPDIPELSEKELLLNEKEVFGFYLTGDPFNEVAPLGRVFSTHTLNRLETAEDGTLCRIAGNLTSFKKHFTKKGDVMAFLTIEADNSSQDITLFPKSYNENLHRLKIDEPLFMVAQVQLFGGSVKVNAEKVYTPEDLNEEGFAKISLSIPKEMANKESYAILREILRNNTGICSFDIKIVTPDGEKVTLKPGAGFRTSVSAKLIREWEKKCGPGSVKISFPELDSFKVRKSWKNGNSNGRSANSASG